MLSDKARGGGAGEGPGTISPSPLKIFFGWLLMAVGGLIALTCGLCTLGFTFGCTMAAIAAGPHTDQNWLGSGMLGLAIGAPPTAIGAGLFVLGLKLARKRAPEVAR